MSSYEMFENLTLENFDDSVFEKDIPSLVFFGAERCNVCKELTPVVEEVMKEYAGKLNFYFVDADKHLDLQKRFRLRGIPQLVIFDENEMKNRLGGLREKEEITEAIAAVLNGQ